MFRPFRAAKLSVGCQEVMAVLYFARQEVPYGRSEIRRIRGAAPPGAGHDAVRAGGEALRHGQGGEQMGAGSFPKLKILYPNPRLHGFNLVTE